MTQISHTPRPGGRIHATQEAAFHEMGTVPDAETTAQPGAEEFPGLAVEVPVRDNLPDLGTARVVTLSAANPVLPVLPQDPHRRSAILIAVDNDVYLSSAKDDVQAVAGTASGVLAGYFPAGIAIPIMNRAAWWAGATTLVGNSRVTVIVSKDGP